MLKSISHRRRLLRKNFRLPHQRNRDCNKRLVLKKSNKPYITVKNDHNFSFKTSKRKQNDGSYKMAYRYRYYKISNLKEKEDSSNE